MRGYKAYKVVCEQKSRAVVVKSQNSKDSLSSNTLERATNQNDLLHLMGINKEESKEDLLKNYNVELPTNEKDKIELIAKPKNKNHIHSKSNNRNKDCLDHISKSFSKIEPDLDKDNSKLKQNGTINKSLRLLKKKRPNSAKTNNEGETKDGENINHVEEIKEIMSKLRLLKCKRSSSSSKKNLDQNLVSNKPPTLPKFQRSESNSQVLLNSKLVREKKGNEK